jgi:hypothetical protein
MEKYVSTNTLALVPAGTNDFGVGHQEIEESRGCQLVLPPPDVQRTTSTA